MVLIACCISCLLKCIEDFVRYLSLHAYIEVALTGKDFCDSAVDAFYLIFRNFIKFGVSIQVFEIFELLSAFYIVCLSLPISIYIINKTVIGIDSQVFFLTFAILISVLVALIFTSLIVFASETILHCYAVDAEITEQEGRTGASFAPEILQEAISDYKQSQLETNK